MNTTARGQGWAEARVLGSDRRERPDRHRPDRRGLPFGAAGIVVVAVLAMILPAGISYSGDEDEMHEVSWLHESPAEVSSFVLFVSPEQGLTSTTRRFDDIGKPGDSDSGTPQVFSAMVPIGTDDFVAVAAIGRNGLLSALSVWSRPQPSQPGQPLIVQP